MISALQLGNIDYGTGLRLQEKLVSLRKDGRVGDILLLLEHAPVITLGRNAKTKNILASPKLLAQRGVEVCECDRGGDVTFHGPGQLVAYPIFDLRGFPSTMGTHKSLGAIEYVRRLEQVLIRTCADFGIPTKRIAGLTGVWTDPIADSRSSTSFDTQLGAVTRARMAESKVRPTASSESKIAALGVHISRGVTSHGIALNVNTDLTFFNLIVPCGIAAKPVTSMSAELNRVLPMQEIAHSLSRNFGAVFNSQILWLDNPDALLGNHFGIPKEKPEKSAQGSR
jgi:lipoyl(octanoyl) transferase